MEFNKPLPPEEQAELFKIKDDPAAREKLILHNTKLVYWVAKKYHKPGKNEMDDLFQQGIIGLMKAIDRYDPDRGAFSSYAVHWIKQSITRDLADTGRVIRVPVHMIQEVNKLIRVRKQIVQEIGRYPSPWELSIRLNMNIDKVNEILSVVQDPISLNTIVGSEDETLTIEDSVIDESSMFEDELVGNMFIQEMKEELKEPILSEQDLNIIFLFYCSRYKQYTTKDIADHLNLTCKQVVQKKSKALRIMRRLEYFRELKEEIEDNTIYYRSPNYGRGEGALSAEQVVINREINFERLLNKNLKENEDE